MLTEGVSMASFLTRKLRQAKNLGRAVTNIPVVGSAIRAIPGVGAGVLALEGASALFGGGGSGSTSMIPGAPDTMGQRSIFRDDPNIDEALQRFAIDQRFLKTYFRGPKGFVVLRDSQGRAYAIPKKIARTLRDADNKPLWKPAKRPPISVGDWSKLMGAKRTVKKLAKVVKTGQSFARFAMMGKSRSGGNLQINQVKGGAGDDIVVLPKKSFRKVG